MKRQILKIKRMVPFVLAVSAFMSMECGVPHKVRNVILIIPDGLSLADIDLSRWYQDGRPLVMDRFACGLVRTYSANSLITDSAAAGSAYATGYKVENETISIRPAIVTMPGVDRPRPEDAHRPLPTLLEAARLKGMATGLVFSGTLNDATPASFSSHVLDRYEMEAIAEQMVYSGVDVLLGGGSAYLLPGAEKTNRKDGEDLTKALKDMGYGYVTDLGGLKGSGNLPRVWGLFRPNGLDAEFDRDPETQPDLAEMTRKAIEILSRDGDGFFLMVESGEIDTFGHDNDPIGIISEVLSFDRALGVAVDFAVRDGHTAVIACPDHPTGGLSIENYGALDDLLSVLKKSRSTSYAVRDRIKEDGSNLKEVLEKEYGLTGLTVEELESIGKDRKKNFPLAIGRVLAARASLSFSTEDHTGEDVVLFAYHPSGYKPTDMAGSGVIQNVDVNRYVQKVLGLDLGSLDDVLHVASAEFEARGAKVALDRSDEANPVVLVTKDTDVLKLPVNKNLAILNGKKIELNGLVTVISGRIWVPRQAVDLIR
jgi:alkaline phosphatase